jgi:RNA polymerase sigma-70 factor (ECF subfamily)
LGRNHQPSERGDTALVLAAKRQDAASPAAYTALVRRHQVWVVRHLWHLLGRRSDAEDVAQEAFVRAYRALPSLGDVQKFEPWLRRLATRLAFNHQRDAKTRRGYEERVPLPRTIESCGAAIEAREVLQNVLGRIRPSHREILLLHYVEELSIKEISDLLEIGVSASKMRLSRARTEFRAVHGEVAVACVTVAKTARPTTSTRSSAPCATRSSRSKTASPTASPNESGRWPRTSPTTVETPKTASPTG